MKKIAVLTSVLTLVACGGGTGGGADYNTPQAARIVTPDMLNQPEIAQKIKTIQYVEENLGSIMEDVGESGTNARMASVHKTGRSSTTEKIQNKTLTLSDLNSRYEKAQEYFDILDKVKNTEKDDIESENITNKDLKIAYSLSVGKPYDKLTSKDLPGIDLDEEKDDIAITKKNTFSNIQTAINDKLETNIDLKSSVTDDIADSMSISKDVSEIDLNAALLNSNFLDKLEDKSELVNMFDDMAFVLDENTNQITKILIEDDEEDIVLDRQGNGSYFKTDKDYWFFDFTACKKDGTNCKAEALEGTDKNYTAAGELDELADLVKDMFESNPYRYAYLSDEDKEKIYNDIASGTLTGKWTSTKFDGSMYSLGKVNGLQYSDFGYYTLDGYNFTFTYNGGIDGKPTNEIDSSLLAANSDTVLTGTAAGQLQHNYEIDGENIVPLKDNNRLIVTDTGAAKLTLSKDSENKLTEKMEMPFNDWYKVTVNRDITANKITTVNFDENGNNIAEGWEITNKNVDYTTSDPHINHNLSDSAVSSVSAVENENAPGWQTTMKTTYYGPNSDEATVFINHAETIPGSYTDEFEVEHSTRNQIWFDAVFGGIKTE